MHFSQNFANFCRLNLKMLKTARIKDQGSRIWWSIENALDSENEVPSAPTHVSARVNPEYSKGERKVKRNENFPYPTHCRKQQDASSKIPTSWKCHKHMNALESIIPLVSCFWDRLAFCARVARPVRQRHAATSLRMYKSPCKKSGVANHSTPIQKLDPSTGHEVLSVEICHHHMRDLLLYVFLNSLSVEN